MKLFRFGDLSKIRNQTLQMTSMMARWCQVREDLMYIFDQVANSDIEDPIRTLVLDFLSRVRGGMAPDRALLLMQKSLPHEHFVDLITAVRFNFKYRGKLGPLLEQMELHFHRIEEEYTHRRLTNLRDCKLTFMILAVVPPFFLIRLATNPEAQQAFGAISSGPLIFCLCLLLYLGAVAAFLFIWRHING